MIRCLRWLQSDDGSWMLYIYYASICFVNRQYAYAFAVSQDIDAMLPTAE